MKKTKTHFIATAIASKEVHKSLYRSAAMDDSQIGMRETYCGKVVKNINVSHKWKNVTCEECLSLRDVFTINKKEQVE